MDRVRPLRKGSVFDWRSLMVSTVGDNCISDHCNVAETLTELVNSPTHKKPKMYVFLQGMYTLIDVYDTRRARSAQKNCSVRLEAG